MANLFRCTWFPAYSLDQPELGSGREEDPDIHINVQVVTWQEILWYARGFE